MLKRHTFGRLLGGDRHRLLSALLAIGAGALAVGIVVGAGIPGSSRGANTSSSSSGTATVQRRDLIATDTQPGTLGYASTQPVFNRLSGTLTSLPSVGTTIRPGEALFSVDGAPVMLFDGAIPAYRTLSLGVSDGPDVAEVKRNLINLGFDPGHAITVNGTFDSATVDAIDRWQASHGKAQTGQITLGQVVFLPGPRRISAVEGVLGSTGGGAAGASGAGSAASGAAGSTTGTGASTVAPATAATPARAVVDSRSSNEFVSLQSTRANAAAAGSPANAAIVLQTATCVRTQSTPNTLTSPSSARCRPSPPPPTAGRAPPTATQLLAQLVAALKKLASSSLGASGRGAGASPTTGGGAPAGRASSSTGGSIGAAGAGAGSGGSSSSSSTGSVSATQILQTTSADLVVTVQLDATKQSEAALGEPVTVQLPDGSVDSGKITGVSSVAQSPSSNSSSGGGGTTSSTPSATVPVTITLTGRRRVVGLDQAAVSVSFQKQVERAVLAVPVTALLAMAGGGYAVQELGSGSRHLVAVTPGLFAGGFVQVSGAGLFEGMTVSDSQG